MRKAQGGYRAIGLFFCSFLFLVSLSAVVMCAPAFGQRTDLKTALCGSSVTDCIQVEVSQLASPRLNPWQEVLLYWKQCHGRLAKDPKALSDVDLREFLSKGDRLLNHPTPVEFHLADRQERQNFLQGLEYWAKKLTDQAKGKPPKSARSLLALHKALQEAIPEVAVADLKRR